jgi:phosphomannomutase
VSLSHVFETTILREYDIRGVVGTTLFEADATAIGRAFGTIVRRRGGSRVAVGRDGRLSSPLLQEALVAGLLASGVDVLDIGLGPTPMLYFAVHELSADGGIQLTGSHNPPDYNGFKMMLGKASFFGEQIQELGRIAACGRPRERQGGTAARSTSSSAMSTGSSPTITAAGRSTSSGMPATASPAPP